MEIIEKHIVIQADTLEKVKRAYANYKKSPKERLTAGYVKGRMDTLEKYWKEFQNIHEMLILSVTMEQRQDTNYFADNTFEAFEEAYYTYKGEMMSKLECMVPTKSESKQTLTPSASNSSEVKLPRISLPSFNGNYTEWQSFHDLFMALVHNNESLQDVQKLHYLKSSLAGEAEALLRQFSITAENYKEAWLVLKKRYANKRYIANCVFKKFFTQKTLTHESATALRQLLDTSVECMSALKHLGLPTNNWDAIINYSIVSKLDSSTHKEWEELISRDETDDLPSFDKLKSFLENRFRTLEMVEPASKVYKPVKTKMFHVTATSEVKCTFCNEDHYIYQCKQFSKQSIEDRYSFVQKNNLCFNCLIPNHNVFKCKQKTTCQICKRKHHSLLHREKQASGEAQTSGETNNNNEEKIQTVVVAHTSSLSQALQPGQGTLLTTALVHVTAESGQSHVLRALVDQGSEESFATARAVELLGLKKTKISGVISGVEECETTIKHRVMLRIQSRYDISYCINVDAYVLKSIAHQLPSKEIRSLNWPQINELDLADPTYGSPRRIDILLGARVYSKILEAGLLKGPGNFLAQKTHLGWILSGGNKDTNASFTVSQHITSLHVTTQVEEDTKLLKRFWEVESELYTKHSMWTKEEEKCEEIYQQTTTRDETGRYVVQLPLKTKFEDTVRSCGNTKHQAVSRLEQLERKFARNEPLKAEYTRVVHDYLQVGHMKKVDTEDEGNEVNLAHCAVIREDKETSKLYVGFDASAKGPHGCSLNSSMMVGPTIQPDLRCLVFRWRTHKICVVGDTIKVYRQVRMDDKHTDLQRIVWRNNTSEKIDSYKLLTVTFGTAAAPHLAVRTLQRLADDEQDNCPRGAAVVRNCFYMDDLHGHEDLDEIKATCKEIHALVKAGGFEMQKWSSNTEELLECLVDGTKTPEPVKDKKEIKLDKIIKIMGLTWDRKDDTCHVNLPASRIPVTERVILSDVASLFDPFGWLSPVVIKAKIMIQKLWLWHCSRDDKLSSEIIQHVDNDRWRHVSSENNPADLASRGIKASELTNNEHWWSGLVSLKETNNEMLRATTIPTTDLECKEKLFHISKQDTPIWERFSSKVKMKRVIAQCKRCLDYKNKKYDILSADELDEVEICCQYSQEFEDLKRKGKVKNKSSLIILTPHVDEHNLLRVGGRLSKADLLEDAKHPIIVRKQTQDFWKKWQSDYLNTLQHKQKVRCDKITLYRRCGHYEGAELTTTPAKWLLGKITALHAGPDNLVRVVTVQCKGYHILKDRCLN